jgi:hypothetical protein
MKVTAMLLCEMEYCDCTLEYPADDEDFHIKGETTKCLYAAKGVYVCPKCHKRYDYSDDTYALRVWITKDDDGYKDIMILGDDLRLDMKYNEHHTYKEAIDDDFSEYLDKWLEKHEEGIFLIDLYWKWSSCWTDGGTEWDCDIFVLHEVCWEKPAERKLDRAQTKLGDF